MHILISIKKDGGDTWTVRVEDSPGKQVLSERTIRRVGAGAQSFPQPLANELSNKDSNEPYYKLCSTANAQDIFDVYANIVSKEPAAGEAVAFGRYMFTTLIGDAAWQKILPQANQAPIEMSLSCAQTEWELHRLPWEMMHDGQEFLAESQGRGAITRVVSGTESPSGEITLRPRILFIVGADLNDARVSPGTEYLGMLKRLREADITLDPLLIRRATSEDIEKEMARFQPSVVHIICHGWFDGGKGYLEFAPINPSDPPTRVKAPELLALMKTKDGLPPVVVLNACYTGRPNWNIETLPMAVELVQGGVPMVVGMAGRVADLACRLFTWSFYKALLNGGSVAEATAQGRRAGIRHSGAPKDRFTDWALPNVFVAEGLSSRVKVDSDWAEKFKKLDRCARALRTRNNPPFLCGRIELMESYRDLMAFKDQKAVLAFKADEYDLQVDRPQYGKSRLLEELAAQAVRDGHIPCAVIFGDADTPPSSPLGIGLLIIDAIRTIRKRLGFAAGAEYEVRKLERLTTGPAQGNLHKDVQDELDARKNDHSHPKVVSAALRVDLGELLVEARKNSANPSLQVLVLIDEAHRFDDAARALVEEMIDYTGFGNNDQSVPVILAFTGVQIRQEHSKAINDLENYFEKAKPSHVIYHRLRSFAPPNEDPRMLYTQYLLHREPPLVINLRNVNEEKIDKMVNRLHILTRGIPSRMNASDIHAAIQAFTDMEILTEADENEILSRP